MLTVRFNASNSTIEYNTTLQNSCTTTVPKVGRTILRLSDEDTAVYLEVVQAKKELELIEKLLEAEQEKLAAFYSEKESPANELEVLLLSPSSSHGMAAQQQFEEKKPMAAHTAELIETVSIEHQDSHTQLSLSSVDVPEIDEFDTQEESETLTVPTRAKRQSVQHQGYPRADVSPHSVILTPAKATPAEASTDRDLMTVKRSQRKTGSRTLTASTPELERATQEQKTPTAATASPSVSQWSPDWAEKTFAVVSLKAKRVRTVPSRKGTRKGAKARITEYLVQWAGQDPQTKQVL